MMPPCQSNNPTNIYIESRRITGKFQHVLMELDEDKHFYSEFHGPPLSFRGCILIINLSFSSRFETVWCHINIVINHVLERAGALKGLYKYNVTKWSIDPSYILQTLHFCWLARVVHLIRY